MLGESPIHFSLSETHTLAIFHFWIDDIPLSCFGECLGLTQIQATGFRSHSAPPLVTGTRRTDVYKAVSNGSPSKRGILQKA